MTPNNAVSQDNDSLTSGGDKIPMTEVDDVMLVVDSAIAGVGIVGNLSVIVVLSSNRRLRAKVPNIFIINQVSCSRLLLTRALSRVFLVKSALFGSGTPKAEPK